MPDHAEYEFKQETLAELRERIAEAQEESRRQTEEIPQFERQRREVMAEVQQAQKERAEGMRAPRRALEQLQSACRATASSANGCIGIDWTIASRCGNRCTSTPAGRRSRGCPARAISAADCRCRRCEWSKDRPGSKLTPAVAARRRGTRLSGRTIAAFATSAAMIQKLAAIWRLAGRAFIPAAIWPCAGAPRTSCRRPRARDAGGDVGAGRV